MINQTRTETVILTLEADKPQQLIGSFSAIKVLQGGYHSIRVFNSDPGTDATSAGVLQSRRLDLDGTLTVGPFKNPYFVAVGQSPTALMNPIKLLLYSGAVGFVETDQADRLISQIVGRTQDAAVAINGELLIGTTGNGVQSSGSGNQELHSRGFWDGWVSSTKAFHVEARIADTVPTEHVMCAIKSRQMGAGEHTVNLGMGLWDTLWSKVAPTTWATVAIGMRLPVPFATKATLYYVDAVATASVVQALVSIRSR